MTASGQAPARWTGDESARFELIGGRICLDFANTLTWAAGGTTSERLATFAHLVAWGEQAGVLDGAQAVAMRTSATQDEAGTARVMDDARRLRAAVHGIFSARAADREPEATHLAALNEALVRATGFLRVGAEATRFHWEWAPDEAPDRVLWHVAWSAANLLADDAVVARVRECGSEGCGWLYLDESRNGSRRWCDMKSCGNRAKARRHYERVRARKLDASCANPAR